MGADLTKITAPEPVSKHPLEDFVVSMDFTKILAADAVIDSILSVSVSPDSNAEDLVVDGEVVSVDNAKIVNVNLSLGIADIDYTVTITVVLADGQIRTGVGIVEVRER